MESEKKKLEVREVVNDSGIDSNVLIAAVIQYLLNKMGRAISLSLQTIDEVIESGIDFRIYHTGDGRLKIVSQIAIEQAAQQISRDPSKDKVVMN